MICGSRGFTLEAKNLTVPSGLIRYLQKFQVGSWPVFSFSHWYNACWFVSFHWYFFEHLERNAVVLFAKLNDLRIKSQALVPPKIIGRESKDNYLAPILFMQFFQTPHTEAITTFWMRFTINRFSFILRKVNSFSLNRVDLEIIKRCRWATVSIRRDKVIVS